MEGAEERVWAIGASVRQTQRRRARGGGNEHGAVHRLLNGPGVFEQSSQLVALVAKGAVP